MSLGHLFPEQKLTAKATELSVKKLARSAGYLVLLGLLRNLRSACPPRQGARGDEKKEKNHSTSSYLE